MSRKNAASRRAVDGQPVSRPLHKASLAPPVQQPFKRRRWLFVLASLLLAAWLAWLAWLAYHARQADKSAEAGRRAAPAHAAPRPLLHTPHPSGRIGAMKVVPLGDKVVIRPTPAASLSNGGIVLPEAAQERTRHGRVLSVGSGRLLRDGTQVELQVSEGDRVLFDPSVGSQVEVDGQELLILREGEILAVVD